MWFTFSRRTAVLIGILLPVAETIRRRGTWLVYPPNYFDDLSIGAFLLFGAWLKMTSDARGLGMSYWVARANGRLSRPAPLHMRTETLFNFRCPETLFQRARRNRFRYTRVAGFKTRRNPTTARDCQNGVCLPARLSPR